MLWISKKDTIRNRISLRYVNVLIKQYIQLNVTKRHRQEMEKSRGYALERFILLQKQYLKKNNKSNKNQLYNAQIYIYEPTYTQG